MFENKRMVVEFFLEWLKKMGFDGTANISFCYDMKDRNGRPAWQIDAPVPYGAYFVYNDTGDVEDWYGRFSNGTLSQMYDKDGNRK